MKILREQDAKRLAMQKAIANGHEMRPWRRAQGSHFRSRSSCKLCGQELLVISTVMEPSEAERLKAADAIIGLYERSVTNVDYTYASGVALMRCTGR